MPRPAREQPWWIEGGSRVCIVCLQRYALEMEHRCVNCDLAICFFCAVAEHGHEITCGECAESPSSE